MTFEQWCVSEKFPPEWLVKSTDGEYLQGPMPEYHHAWRAAISAEREACAAVCAAADKSTHPANRSESTRAPLVDAQAGFGPRGLTCQ